MLIYLLGNYKMFIYIIHNIPTQQSHLNIPRHKAIRLSKIPNSKKIKNYLF